MTWAARIWLWAAEQNPAAPWMLLPLVAWLSCWALRTGSPTTWEWFARMGPPGAVATKAWQAAPSVLLGSLLAASSLGLDPGQVALAAGVTLAAPVWHELLAYVTSRVPWLPTYYGGSYPAAGTSLPPSEAKNAKGGTA